LKSLLELINYQRGDYVTTPNENHIWRVVDIYPTDDTVCLRLYKMKDQHGFWKNYDNLKPITCENDGLVLYMAELP
jgi:hypothetical protein